MGIRIHTHALTDVGLQRDENEDAFDIVPESRLYIVADGMGGHASGQVASKMAVESIRQYIRDIASNKDHQFTYPVPNRYGPPEQLLSNAIQWANERLFIESMKEREYEGMGTTVVCVMDYENVLVLGHVGDSRIYRYRGGVIKQVTRDHSLLNHYIDEGKLNTPEEISSFSEGNIIVRALGLKDYVEPEINVIGKEDGDIYLLCTDGLTDLVDDWIIANVLEGNGDSLEEACETLVRLANDAGGKDNCTVMLMQVAADGTIEPSSVSVEVEADIEATPTSVPAMSDGDDEQVGDVEATVSDSSVPWESDESTPVSVPVMVDEDEESSEAETVNEEATNS